MTTNFPPSFSFFQVCQPPGRQAAGSEAERRRLARRRACTASTSRQSGRSRTVVLPSFSAVAVLEHARQRLGGSRQTLRGQMLMQGLVDRDLAHWGPPSTSSA